MPDEHLSGAQISRIEKSIKDAVEQRLATIELRKFALDCAIRRGGADDPVGLAKQLYDFLMEPLADIKVTIDQPK